MFKLLIECTKDISEISINFADGTSVVKSSEPETTKPKPEKSKPDKKPNFSEARRELLDLDDSGSNIPSVKQSQVTKPEITDHDREVKVATELQNLDI